jgi:myo-inositol-1(or 4)-monophosphatase
MPPSLTDIQTLARRSGDILRAGFGQSHQIGYKGPVDLVTEVDHRSEEFIVNFLQEHFPGDRIITEESGILEGDNANKWYIDPLDGTVNYAHGVPIYCVSIAYVEAGKQRLAAVYDPGRDELFSAELGRGAQLNERPIHVSQAPDLLHSLLVTGFPYDAWSSPRNNLENFARLTRQTQGVRRLGSAALDLCYVAAGRFDGYWEMKLHPWDLAAGSLIAAEAGARVTDLEGQQGFLEPPFDIVAAHPGLHALLLDALHASPQSEVK